jgi:hypothetical protein
LLWLLIAAAGFAGTLAGYSTEPQIAWKHFRGICDASAMEMLDNDLFLVADDEDNMLRIYSRSREGLPVAAYDFSRFLGLTKRTKEIDFEGSARIGDHIFFISSHGANSKGKFQPSRHRLFAVRVTGEERLVIRPSGYYSQLYRDLSEAPELASFNLRRAASLPPKAPGGLNIEGLAATPEGHLLIGFRSPIPGGDALVLPIQNPMDLLRGQRAQFGRPILVSLNGLGIRSVTRYRDGYLMVAGSYLSDQASHLYRWNGRLSEAILITREMPGNPEGMAVLTDIGRDVLFALSDDGTVKVGNHDCKKLKDSSQKVFRAYEMPLGLHLTRK